MNNRHSGSHTDLDDPSEHIEQLPDRSAGRSLRSTSRGTPCDALVLDARLRQSLLCVRSLGRRGLRVAAVGTRRNVPSFASRWCQRGLVCHAHEGSDAYMACLERLLLENDAPVLIASSDATVAMVRKHRALLERKTFVALASDAALDVASNKECTLGIARNLGLATPRSVHILTVGDVPAAIHEVGLPAVIKPAFSWVCGERGHAGLVSHLVVSVDEARAVVEHIQEYGVPMLFQEHLGGRREAMMFLYSRGEMYARFAQWAKRTVPPLGGTSVMRQSIEIPPDIGVQAECLVRELDLEGYSEVEFRRDDMGKPYLMEINPRLSASVEVAVRAGVDFPYLLFQWASGQHIDQVKGYRVGGWMRHLGGDIQTTWQAVRYQRGRPGVPPPTRALLDFCRDCVTPAAYDYMGWQDPLPACLATVGFCHDLVVRKSRRRPTGTSSSM